jgi:hypothetical protein
VSDLLLISGLNTSGIATEIVLIIRVAGLLVGAWPSGAGVYVSALWQREQCEASTPENPTVLADCDVDGNEFALVYGRAG